MYVFSKLLEKIMKLRLVKYTDRINFLSAYQFGFRKGNSTEDALILVINNIKNNLIIH